MNRILKTKIVSFIRCSLYALHRSPVTHKMAPWVSRVFIKILPRILCIQRPKKEEHPEDEATEVLTDVFHVPSDIDKFTDYGSKRFSQDYGIPGKDIPLL